MVARSKNREHRVNIRFCGLRRGQATIELALTLPFVIFLIYYTLNSYYTIHTGHVAQRYAAMNLYKGLNNRAYFVMDDAANGGQGTLHNKNFMAYQYQDTAGGLPKRKIVFGPLEIDNIVGICREPGCN